MEILYSLADMAAINSLKQIVIAIGTGRAGSVSLYRLLEQQPDVAFSHEQTPLLPWEVSRDLFNRKISALLGRKGRIVGDICHSWLPYVPMLMERYPEARVICLQRDCEAVVSSYIQKLQRKNKNHWARDHGKRWRRDPRFDPTVPKYEPMELEDAVRRYWLEYHQAVDALIEKYPGRVRKWKTEVALNEPESASTLLTFIGIGAEHQKLSVGERHNTSRTTSTDLQGGERTWLRRVLGSLF